jgi:hypothetical protein
MIVFAANLLLLSYAKATESLLVLRSLVESERVMPVKTIFWFDP